MGALALSDDSSCQGCLHRLLKQCANLMAEHLYQFARPRGEGEAERIAGIPMHGAIKERAVNLVANGEYQTLEDALSFLGYGRRNSRTIFQDKVGGVLKPQLKAKSLHPSGLPISPHVPQPAGVQSPELLSGPPCLLKVPKARNQGLCSVVCLSDRFCWTVAIQRRRKHYSLWHGAPKSAVARCCPFKHFGCKINTGPLHQVICSLA